MFCLEGYFSVENLNVIEVINFLIGLDLRQCYSDLGGESTKFVFFSPESQTGQNQHQEVFPFQVFNVPLGICSITK